MPHILTVRDVGHPTGLASYVARFWRSDLHGPFPLDLLARPSADVEPLAARVNAGRWIVDCPTRHCRGAAYVDLDDLRFFCVMCANPDVEGQWMPVVLPDGRGDIEEVLLDRPVPSTRNWVPGETPKDLGLENAAEGAGRGR